MDDWTTLFLDKGLPAVLAATASFGASLYGVRLALRRFYQERWWEQRFQAYRAVIEAVHQVETCAGAEFENIVNHTGSEECRSGLMEKASAAQAELERSLGLGEFLFSPEMVRELERFQIESSSPSDETWSDQVQRLLSAAHKLASEARRLARQDLKLRE